MHFSHLLTAQIENPDLGVRDTTAKPRFWVWLVLTVTVASSGTATHLDWKECQKIEISKKIPCD